MESSLSKFGGNDYKLPRGKKKGMSEDEKEDFNNKCDYSIYNNAMEFYNTNSQ